MAQENLITASGIPYTIVRSTQFFEFVGAIAQSENMALRWQRLTTIRACDLSLTYSLRAKRRGSR